MNQINISLTSDQFCRLLLFGMAVAALMITGSVWPVVLALAYALFLPSTA